MTNENFDLFFTLTKVDENTRQVWGRATAQEQDLARETMHYDSSKPNFQKWSQDAMSRTAILGPEGTSLGNIREMHNPQAAGKAIQIDYDDMAKAIDIGTVCVDDGSWEKIRKGVLTGFSIGGTAKRWRDPLSGQVYYTAEPQEISYVDAPCLPSAQFKMIKRDGSEIMEKVGFGLTAADDNPAITQEGANAITQPDQPPVVTVPSGEIVKEIAAPASGAPNPAIIEQRAVLPITQPRTEPVEKTVDVQPSAVDNLLSMIKAQRDSEQRAQEVLKSLGARVGIARREGAPLEAASGYSKNSADWGDPANLRWPMDNLERLDNAIAKYNGGQDLHGYELRERSILGHRLAKQARLIRGGDFYFDAQKRQVMKVEAPKMLPTLEKGVDLGGLVSQLMQGINVAVDQIGKDPNAARDLLMQLMGNVSSSATVSSVDTGTANPTPPTGSQQGYTDTTLSTKAAMSGSPDMTLATAVSPSTPSVPTGGGMTGTTGSTPMNEATSGNPLSTPQSAPSQTVPATASIDKGDVNVSTPSSSSSSSSSSSPSSSSGMDKRDEQIDALTKQLAQLTQIVASVVNPSAPVQKLLQPLPSILATPVPTEPEMHPALKKLLETGDVVAAARILNPDRPDISKLREMAQGQALMAGQADFTNMALRKGYATQATFQPSLPADMPQYPVHLRQ